jgi:hypothetical protein
VAPPPHVVSGLTRQRVARPSRGLGVNCRPCPAVRERRWWNFTRTGYKKKARGSAHTPPTRLCTHPTRRKPRSPGRLHVPVFAPPRVPAPNPDSDPTPAEARANPARRAPHRLYRDTPVVPSQRRCRQREDPPPSRDNVAVPRVAIRVPGSANEPATVFSAPLRRHRKAPR